MIGNPHNTMSIDLALRVNKGLSSDEKGNFADIASYQIERDNSGQRHGLGFIGGGNGAFSSFDMLATISDDGEEEGGEGEGDVEDDSRTGGDDGAGKSY